MFADLQESILIAYGAIFQWELSAVVAGVVVLILLIVGLGILKRGNSG
jgi:hypothetical protein